MELPQSEFPLFSTDQAKQTTIYIYIYFVAGVLIPAKGTLDAVVVEPRKEGPLSKRSAGCGFVLGSRGRGA